MNPSPYESIQPNRGACKSSTDYYITNTGSNGQQSMCVSCPPNTTYSVGRGCIDKTGMIIQPVQAYPVQVLTPVTLIPMKPIPVVKPPPHECTVM